MKQKPNLNPEEWVISFSDVKQLYIAVQKKLLRWAICGACLSFGFFALKEVKFESQATFKESVETHSYSGFFSHLMDMSSISSHTPKASSIMKSQRVLYPVVEKLGLQIDFLEKKFWLQSVIERLFRSICAERKKSLSDLERFIFENVHYTQEEPCFLHIVFKDEKSYEVWDERKTKLLASSLLKEPVQVKDALFTLVAPPTNYKVDRFYPFCIAPLSAKAGAVASIIKIEQDPDHASLLQIKASHKNRFLAAEIVNELMDAYRDYLKQEYETVVLEELNYLESKQKQLAAQMDTLFEKKSLYFQKNLEKSGFAALEQESQSLLAPYQKMYNRSLTIETELAHLTQALSQKNVDFLSFDEHSFPTLGQVVKTIYSLKQQRDLLELSLSEEIDLDFSLKRAGLEKIRQMRVEVESALQSAYQGGVISSLDQKSPLFSWASGAVDISEKKDLTLYLENYARLLSMREKVLQERIFYGDVIPKELEGIDLHAANALFVEYNTKLDHVEGVKRHYLKLKDEIPKSSFNLASLSAVLKDDLSQKMIQAAADLELKLKDEEHTAKKEKKRWIEDIQFYRKVLLDHIEQLYLVEELNADLIRQKMVGLQEIRLDGMNRQISVLSEQVVDLMKEKKGALLLERGVLGQKMAEVRERLAEILPERWRFEKWLDLKTEMATKIMETVTEVAESKSLASQMHHVESKPLDFGLVPTSPEPPKLFLFSFIGAFAFALCPFSFALISQMRKGFGLSYEKLKIYKLPVVGRLSGFCDGPSVEKLKGEDLNTIRHMDLFAKDAKVISLILGKGGDYSFALGENLGLKGIKTIIVRCDFHTKSKRQDALGLLQLLQKPIQELPIQKGKGFDFITSGGYSPYGMEMVFSKRFSEFVELLKKHYDRVYLLFRSPLSSAESIAALDLCEKAIVTVGKEQTEELTPFVDWGYDEECCRITFVAQS